MKTSTFAVCAATLLFTQFTLGHVADGPTWRYYVIFSESPTEGAYSGLIFNFDNPTAETATVEVSLDVDGQHLDLKADVQTDRIRTKDAGFIPVPMKQRDTLKLRRATITMGNYSGVYDNPEPAKEYGLVLSRKKGGRL
jgi:hypothetical protein